MRKKHRPPASSPSHARQGAGFDSAAAGHELQGRDAALAVGNVLRLRCPAGKFALRATEAEVRRDGARIAGGNGAFEFDLSQEAWIEIVIVRP